MKRIILVVLTGGLLALGAAVPARAQAVAAVDTGEVEITARELADRLVEYAETFLGTPYRYGANGPKRFDCTGYTRYVYGHFGYHNLSRSAKDQAKDGREVDISDFHNLQKGDILAIGSRRNPKVVGHAAIFVGLDSTGRDPRFIHASVHGVRYSSMLTESYYANRILGARRILPDFEDFDVVFDSTAVYAFEPEIGVHIAPDSLVLAENDRRIVLFENGKWAYVAEDGTLILPETGGHIILAGDGNWAPVREAKVSIPASALKADPRDLAPDPEATAKPATSAKPGTTAQSGTPKASAPKATATTATTPANNTATPTQSAQAEKVYYTIKKGDTLSKIAKQHHTSVSKLCQLNGMTTSTILKVGKKIRVK
ncbi:MAG: C40 family peptidase [Bacteroidales bacterium]|nr:C40 family peptidase [Bacteroidales bacterium]